MRFLTGFLEYWHIVETVSLCLLLGSGVKDTSKTCSRATEQSHTIMPKKSTPESLIPSPRLLCAEP